MFELPFQIRLMKVSDLDAVMLIEEKAYPYPWTRGNFNDCLKSGYYACVLEEAGLMIGYALMSSGAGEAHVLNICITPKYQGQGLGRSLLHELESEAGKRKVDMLLLEVRSSNSKAISLYDSMGFNELGVRKNYYPSNEGREDALILARQLF